MTEKQKRAFKKSVENGGNVSRAMREAGYSPATAKTPQKLTESNAWQELMEKYLPDELLMMVHLDGLLATSQTKLGNVPDHPTRHKFLDTALKLKDKYPAEKHKHEVNTMPVPGLVDLLHKYGATRDKSDAQGDSEAEG